MRRQFVAPLAVGLVVIAIVVAAVLYMQRGAHIELKGTILKVRSAALDENSSVLVLDFRFVNPSSYPFIIRKVDVIIEDKNGRIAEGMTVAEIDAQRLFQYYPLLGQKYNTSLLARDKVGPHQSEDRMIAARFDLPEAIVQARKKLTLRIEEVDGAVSELVQ